MSYVFVFGSQVQTYMSIPCLWIIPNGKIKTSQSHLFTYSLIILGKTMFDVFIFTVLFVLRASSQLHNVPEGSSGCYWQFFASRSTRSQTGRRTKIWKHTSWFWPSCSAQSHWRQAGAPQPGWHRQQRRGGGSWRTNTAASAASAGQWGAWGRLCSHLTHNTQKRTKQICHRNWNITPCAPLNHTTRRALIIPYILTEFDQSIDVLRWVQTAGDAPAAPPSAFPKVEFTMWTLSITPSSSSVPLRAERGNQASALKLNREKHIL